MLDRLPPEILDAILVLTYSPAPWPDMSDKDKERRDSLYRFSLVCRALSFRAQILLWGLPGLAEAVKTVRTNGSAHSGDGLPLLRACLGVKELQSVGGKAKWDDLAGLSLTTLDLRGIWLFLPPTTLSLPVTRLSFLDMTISEDDSARLFTREVLPHVQALWLGKSLSPTSRGWRFPAVPPAFAQQLDLLVVESNEDTPVPPSLLSLPTTVIVSANFGPDLSALIALNPPRIRSIEASSAFEADGWTSPGFFDGLLSPQIAALTAYVASPTPPTSLHLLRFLRTLDPSNWPRFRATFDVLLEACERNKVEVFWHDDDEAGAFPESFWAYAKRLKAEAAEGSTRAVHVE
ncbi:hypothetical protein JCM8097_006600 [Rhodosporidiobolus ruineniae]